MNYLFRGIRNCGLCVLYHIYYNMNKNILSLEIHIVLWFWHFAYDYKLLLMLTVFMSVYAMLIETYIRQNEDL